jgi:hypothetical protein
MSSLSSTNASVIPSLTPISLSGSSGSSNASSALSGNVTSNTNITATVAPSLAIISTGTNHTIHSSYVSTINPNKLISKLTSITVTIIHTLHIGNTTLGNTTVAAVGNKTTAVPTSSPLLFPGMLRML